MEEICGFVVLRKPEHAHVDIPAGEDRPRYTYNSNFQLDGKVYRGVDRLPWEDLSLGYYGYTEKLSEALLSVWQQLQLENSHLAHSPCLVRDYEKALVVQQAFSEQTEIVAVWSPEFAESYGSFEFAGTIKYLGLDCFGSQEWSVIQTGIFLRPSVFAEFIPCLNEFGLLSSNADCDRLFKRYVEVSKESEYDAESLMKDSRPVHLKIFLAG